MNVKSKDATQSRHRPIVGSSPQVTLARVIRFLSEPRSYPHRPRQVHMLQTHASLVFIAGRHVYKIKKPVNFGFLDFRSLENRRLDCEREVQLNQRLAPHVYEGVIPILRSGRTLVLGNVCERNPGAVEYAVKMKHLPKDGFLDQRLDRGLVRSIDLDQVGKVLSRFYQSQRPDDAIATWGRVSKLRISTEENFQQLIPFVGKTITASAFEIIQRFTRRFFIHHRALFESRIRQGRILDCHGDLHLEHIHIQRGKVSIYDCIEFNQRFRYVDVASDLAFLAMDLDFRGHHALARHWLSSMAHRLNDPGLLDVSRFYLCYRAMVRGKVESFHSEASQASEEERRSSAGLARRCFQLALRYAVSGVEPCVWVIMGGIGSGKSTVARSLVAELGCRGASSDEIRKRLAGLPLYQRTPDPIRKTLYTRKQSQRTYRALSEFAVDEIRQGRMVILDATYGQPLERRHLIQQVRKAGGQVRFVEMVASPAQVHERLRLRGKKGGEVSDARLEDWAELRKHYQRPHEIPKDHRATVRSRAGVSETLGYVLAAMERMQGRISRDLNEFPRP